MNKIFDFDERKHVYTLDGKPLNGVTTVLGVISKQLTDWAARVAASKAFRLAQKMELERFHGLVDALDKLPENIDKAQADRLGRIYGEYHEARVAHDNVKKSAGIGGTNVHKEVETWIKARLGGADRPAYSNLAQKFIDWAVKNEVTFHESEKKMYSEKLWLAGTCDFACTIKGKKFVGDLKTMAKMWDRVPFFQTAAYMMMLEEQGEKYDGSVIININKETAELTEHFSYDHESDKEAFLACLTLYRKLNQ